MENNQPNGWREKKAAQTKNYYYDSDLEWNINDQCEQLEKNLLTIIPVHTTAKKKNGSE